METMFGGARNRSSSTASAGVCLDTNKQYSCVSEVLIKLIFLLDILAVANTFRCFYCGTLSC
jgi:hypothetical protein